MFEVFAPLPVVGRAVEEVDPPVEPVAPDAELGIILLGLERFDGQGPGDRQGLFEPRRHRGPRRGAEGHHAAARLQIDGNDAGLGDGDQPLVHGNLVGGGVPLK